MEVLLIESASSRRIIIAKHLCRFGHWVTLTSSIAEAQDLLGFLRTRPWSTPSRATRQRSIRDSVIVARMSCRFWRRSAPRSATARNLIGGMLVENVPDWPQDTQVIGTEGRVHFLVFPQGGDRVRLYLCYDFTDKATYAGPQRRENLISAFARLTCLPYAPAIAAARPIGPFNSFSHGVCWYRPDHLNDYLAAQRAGSAARPRGPVGRRQEGCAQEMTMPGETRRRPPAQ